MSSSGPAESRRTITGAISWPPLSELAASTESPVTRREPGAGGIPCLCKCTPKITCDRIGPRWWNWERCTPRVLPMGATSQSTESVDDFNAEIVADPSTALRYQSSDEAHANPAQELVCTTGQSVLIKTVAILHP